MRSISRSILNPGTLGRTSYEYSSFIQQKLTYHTYIYTTQTPYSLSHPLSVQRKFEERKKNKIKKNKTISNYDAEETKCMEQTSGNQSPYFKEKKNNNPVTSR